MNKYRTIAIVWLVVSLSTSITVAADSDAQSAFAPTGPIIAYDDEGKPITEADIRPYLVSNYKSGCCLLGGCVGSAASFLLGCAMADSASNESVAWAGIWAAGTAVSVWVSRQAGKDMDRCRAVELVKKERRTGQKFPPPKQGFRDSVVAGIIIVGSTMLAICVVGG